MAEYAAEALELLQPIWVESCWAQHTLPRLALTCTWAARRQARAMMQLHGLETKSASSLGVPESFRGDA